MVIAILMVILGVVSMLRLPTAQFPNIAPPEIQVKATYPGADAQTVEQSVATPIEQQMSGVDNMNYMYSPTPTTAQMTLTVELRREDRSEHRSDPRADAHQPGKLAVARRCGQLRSHRAEIHVGAPDAGRICISPKGTYDNIFLANYAYINLNDQLTRVPGIAQRDGLRRRAVRHALLGETGPAGETRGYCS